MRIDLNAGNTVHDNPLERSAAPPARPAAAQPDESRIPPAANSVSALAERALNAPETRTQKVEALRSQIRAGTYQVSSDQVARSVLEHIQVH